MWLYLDNSAINEIAYDPNADEIIKKIKSFYVLRVSALNIWEVASSLDFSKRVILLRTVQRLLTGSILDAPFVIIQKYLDAFFDGKKTANIWLPKRDYVYSMVRDPYSAHDEAREEVLSIKTKWEQHWQQFHEGLRPEVQAQIQENSKAKPKTGSDKEVRRSGFLRLAWEEDVFINAAVADVVDTYKPGRSITGREKALIQSSDVWPFMFSAWGIGIYNRSIQLNSYSAKRNAGGIDTQQAVYLALTDVFVTNDQAQRKMLRLAARTGKKYRRILSYPQLLKSIGLK